MSGRRAEHVFPASFASQTIHVMSLKLALASVTPTVKRVGNKIQSKGRNGYALFSEDTNLQAIANEIARTSELVESIISCTIVPPEAVAPEEQAVAPEEQAVHFLLCVHASNGSLYHSALDLAIKAGGSGGLVGFGALERCITDHHVKKVKGARVLYFKPSNQQQQQQQQQEEDEDGKEISRGGKRTFVARSSSNSKQQKRETMGRVQSSGAGAAAAAAAAAAADDDDDDDDDASSADEAPYKRQRGKGSMKHQSAAAAAAAAVASSDDDFGYDRQQ
jgi:hypothetical protein